MFVEVGRSGGKSPFSEVGAGMMAGGGGVAILGIIGLAIGAPKEPVPAEPSATNAEVVVGARSVALRLSF
jgi:hypothetical protein